MKKVIFYHHHYNEQVGVYAHYEWECSLSSVPTKNDEYKHVDTYTRAQMLEQMGTSTVVYEAERHFAKSNKTYYCQ